MEIDQPAFTPLSNDSGDADSVATSAVTPAVDHNNLITFPKKRSLCQDDPFFQEGTYEYKAAWLRLEDTDAYIPDMLESEYDDREKTRTLLTPAQACYVGRCHGEWTFSNAAAYEHHYETNHRHICETCKKPFPGEKWLELHLREVHDVMVRIKRERGERTYQCFVEGCDRMCSTPQKRRRHMIDKHHYPKWFNFAVILTGVVPFNERMKEAQKEKALWQSREQGRQKVNQNKSQHVSHPQYQRGHPGYQSATDSKAMDVEPAATATSAQKNANRRISVSSESESGSKKTSELPPKKNAFKQYRTPGPRQTPRRSSFTADQDMETDTVLGWNTSTTPVATPSGHGSQGKKKDKIDMDIDQLQQSMAQLMVPRSVANKMRNSNDTTSIKPRKSDQ